MTTQTKLAFAVATALSTFALPAFAAPEVDEFEHRIEELERSLNQARAELEIVQQKDKEEEENQSDIAKIANQVDVYGSLRMAVVSRDGDTDVEDNTSRIGMKFSEDVTDDVTMFFHWEEGVNLTTEDGEDTFYNRLAYMGIEHDMLGSISFGKQWSTYYDVSSFTDMLMGQGEWASGTKYSGPVQSARTDNTLQYRYDRGALQFGYQYQMEDGEADWTNEDGNISGNVVFDNAQSASLRYSITPNITLGLANTWAELDTAIGDTRGIDDDAKQWVAGVRFENEKWYAAAIYNQSENMMEDNTGEFFDAEGAEIYVRYNINEKLDVYSSFHKLEEDGDKNYEGEFQNEVYQLGTTYQWSNNFLTYAEVHIDEGKDAAGDSNDNRLFLGMWFNF